MKRIKPTTKRRIAGVIALLLAIVLVLGMVAPFFRSFTAYGAEPQDYTVEAQVGFNGAVKIEQKAPVSLKVTNNSGTTFKGQAVIRTKNAYHYDIYTASSSSGDDSYIEYFSDIELAAGETKEITGSISVGYIESTYTVQLVTGKGKTAAEQTVPVKTESTDSKWLGVMSSSKRTMDAVSQSFTQFSNHYGFTRAVEITPDYMEYLANLSMLAVNDCDLNSLDDAQLAALKSWVNGGGVLVVGYDGDVSTQNWFNYIAQEGYTGGAVSPASDDYSDGASSLLENIIENYVDDDEQYVITEISDQLGAEAKYKFASVIAYNGQNGTLQVFLDELEERYWNNDHRYAYEILNEYEILKSGAPDFKQSDYYSDAEQSRENIDVQGTSYAVESGSVYVFPSDSIAEDMINAYIMIGNPSYTSNYQNFGLAKPTDILGGLFLGFIMLYAIFIGPVLYAILKKKDKKESAVRIIPASAAVLAGIIVLCSVGSNFQRPLVSVVNLVDASEGGARAVTGTAVCAAPIKGELHIQNDTLNNVNVKTDDGYRYYRQSNNKSYRIAFDRFDYTALDAIKWQTNSFDYTDTMELNGVLDISVVKVDNDDVTISVTNNTGYDLEDICLCGSDYFSKYYAAKKLANGETLEFTGGFGDYYNYYTNTGKNASERMKFNKLNDNKQTAAETNGQYIKVTGFAKNDLSGDFKMNGRRASKNEATALYNGLTSSDIAAARNENWQWESTTSSQNDFELGGTLN